MIEIDEQRLARAADVGDAGRGRHVLERAAPRVAQQVAASVAADDEQVEPAVVVDVGNGRRRRRPGSARPVLVGDVRATAALHEVEPCHEPPLGGRPDGSEKVVGAVAVDVAGGNRGGHAGRVRRGAGRFCGNVG